MKCQQSQGFEPNQTRRLIRCLARFILKVLAIRGSTLWGNVVIQQFNQTIENRNPFDNSQKLKLHSFHERLYWRCTETVIPEPVYANFVKTMSKESVLWDIGANVGITSVIPAQAFGCTVIAFEPEPINYSILHKNIFLNRVENLVTTFCLALSEKNQLSDFYLKSIEPGDALHSLIKPSPYLSPLNQDKVYRNKVMSLSGDYLYKTLHLPTPTHIKIDVDGAEVSVLNGMKNVLAVAKNLYIEVDFSQKGTHNPIYRILNSLGFELLSISKPENEYSQNVKNVLFVK